ncbi:MAG: hypothetical protein QXH51_06825 [Candidatus Bathyarchaeia archaeon]
MLDEGVIYEAESDKAYVIRRVGTNSTTAATFSVAGVNCLTIVDKVARISPSAYNPYGPLDLGTLFIVVPPSKKFGFKGEAGSKMYIEGEILELAPGEVLTPDLLARYAEQGKHYLSYLSGLFSKGTGVSWPADEENAVIDYTVPAGEKHVINRGVYADITGLAAPHAPGDWSLRFYKHGAPLDILSATMGDPGIDIWNMCYIYDTTVYHNLFSLEKMPIVLEPGRRLTIKARNVSGAAKSPAAGASITVTAYLIDEVTLLG